MQVWHIRAEDKRNESNLYVEFDITEYGIRQLICVLLKRKNLVKLGRIFLDVYCETSPLSEEWCLEKSLPFMLKAKEKVK